MQGQAGHYGSHHCDLPIVTLDLLLDTLRDLHPKPDFLIYTGILFTDSHNDIHCLLDA